MSYSAAHTLPFRVELIRQVRRKRTLIAYLFIVALPLIVAGAVKFGPSSDGGGDEFGGGGLDLIGLATHSAANFTATMFYFATGFVLITVVAIFCGDTVASEASWSTLRYLLFYCLLLLTSSVELLLALAACKLHLVPRFRKASESSASRL